MSKLIDNRYNNAISALTYGFNCLIWDSRTEKLYDCILSIHEGYINILHIIIAKKYSYLLKLNEIYNITDTEFSIQSKLKEFNIYHYIILYTQSLESFVFASRTEYEKQQLKIALVLFIRQAKLYFERLNEFDPFKAEAMMTFLHADKDGGNMLDIDQIQSILQQMKIFKKRQQIQVDIEEIDRYLYERQKMKKPKDMTNEVLNQLGFQYLLRFYSIKEDLARYFSTFCPMFKMKQRSTKNLIVDIVRYNEKPIMSASQLCDFYQKILVQKTTEQACLNLIKSFPVYDGEGKEKLEENDMISFNNFCSLLSSKRNSAFQENKKQHTIKLTNPLSDYFIYSDFSNYSTEKKSARINEYELSLKRGCRCMKIKLQTNKTSEIIVKLDPINSVNVDQILKIISKKAFEFNTYPLILKIQQLGLNKNHFDLFAKKVKQAFEDLLFTLPTNFQENQTLPSPNSLQKKILIMAPVNIKLLKAKQKDFPDESFAFFKIVSLFESKLDFERKAQNCWNYCSLQQDRVKKFQQDEDEPFSNYTKKVLIKISPSIIKGSQVNFSSSLAIRLGIQVLGLSFSTINQQNYILQSLFLQNGGSQCGYLSKPSWMCLHNPKTLYAKNFESPQFILSVKAISAQNCIINEHTNGDSYYLQIFLRGNKRQQDYNKKYTSKIQNSGYYTTFNLQSQFTIYCLDLAILVVIIRAQKTNKILSGRAIPIRYLRQGLRPMYLMGDNFKQNTSSYVYIHSQKKDIPKKISNFFQNKN